MKIALSLTCMKKHMNLYELTVIITQPFPSKVEKFSTNDFHKWLPIWHLSFCELVPSSWQKED